MRLLQHYRQALQQLLRDSCGNCSLACINTCTAAIAAGAVHVQGALARRGFLQPLSLLLHVVVADALGLCILQHLPQRRADAALCRAPSRQGQQQQQHAQSSHQKASTAQHYAQHLTLPLAQGIVPSRTQTHRASTRHNYKNNYNL
jgi:hypothetical protein